MKTTTIHDLFDSTMENFDEILIVDNLNQEPTKDRFFEQLQLALSELRNVKQALKTTQDLLEVTQQKNETILATNANLKQKLVRLRKKCSQALHLAHHDELTGLPNRSLLLDRLKQAMAQADRHHTQVVLLFIDLDNFKCVNDQLGHAAGDKLLQQVAERLTVCVRYGDTACRYGGDEFVILLPEIVDYQSVLAVVMEKVRTLLAAPFVLDGNIIEVSASIGTTVYYADGQNYTDLIQEADRAMYLDKTHHKLPKQSSVSIG